MVVGKCPVCEKVFKKTRKSHIYCSKHCAGIVSKKRYRERMKKPDDDGIIHIRESKKTCIYCGKEYFGKRNSKYCSKTCQRTTQFKRDMEKEKLKRAGEKKIDKYHKDEQPCWTCKKACGGCLWSSEFKPVEGWVAKKTKIKWQNVKVAENGKIKDCSKYDESYRIISCPEYEEG